MGTPSIQTADSPPTQIRDLGCVFILVQLNKYVVCVSDLQRGHNGDGCFSSSILFNNECRVGYLFILGWDIVRRVALDSIDEIYEFTWDIDHHWGCIQRHT